MAIPAWLGHACTLMHLLRHAEHTLLCTCTHLYYFQMYTLTFTQQCTQTHSSSQMPCVGVHLCGSQKSSVWGSEGYPTWVTFYTTPDSLKGKRQVWSTLTLNLEQKDECMLLSPTLWAQKPLSGVVRCWVCCLSHSLDCSKFGKKTDPPNMVYTTNSFCLVPLRHSLRKGLESSLRVLPQTVSVGKLQDIEVDRSQALLGRSQR